MVHWALASQTGNMKQVILVLAIYVSCGHCFFWSLTPYHTFKRTLHGMPKEVNAPTESYDKFNLGQYEKGSPEWNLAMINYLLELKKQGGMVNQPAMTEGQKPGGTQTVGDEDGNIVCKMEPLNQCYTIDEAGNMHPIGEHRPVRLLRIY